MAIDDDILEVGLHRVTWLRYYFAEEELRTYAPEVVLDVGYETGRVISNGAFVPEELAKPVLSQPGQRLAGIHMARGQLAGRDFAPVIDCQVEFEAVKPAHGSLAPGRHAGKNPVARNAFVVADLRAVASTWEQPHGIASHDTFGDGFARLDPVQLQDCLVSWTQVPSHR